MKTVLIVGAGQLGSRHLQGLIKSTIESFDIHILDTSDEALRIAHEREQEIIHSHKINYHSNWENLPKRFFIVIVATNSNVREQIITRLLTDYNVTYLILEKVLFQELEAYDRVSEILANNQVKVWVNHPRRMFGHYKQIKSILDGQSQNLTFSVVGTNWGLGCNSLHFIDLFSFLSESVVTEIDSGWIHHAIIPSKREGYSEFTGTINGRMANGTTFTLNSLPGLPGPITVMAANQFERIIIQESGIPQMVRLSASDKFLVQVSAISSYYQSSLTTQLIEDLISNGICELPTYEDAKLQHTLFIKETLLKYNQITGINTKTCPIT